ncbi:MAG: hypothetical protein GY757_21130, partial [bacterium]|nr:hypothetical protein [bacterium]
FTSDSDVNTRKDSPGYHYHMAPEITALSIEAQLFQNTYRTRYTQWVRQWFPSGSAALADALPWDVREFPQDKKQGHSGDGQLVEWLASGQLVPEPFRHTYTGARDWFFGT